MASKRRSYGDITRRRTWTRTQRCFGHCWRKLPNGLVANEARIRCARYDPNTADVVRYLAKGLVDALASPSRRGLIGILDDIKNQIGETPPVWSDVKKALQDMCAHIDRGGQTYDEASKLVRHYLTQPIGRG